MIFTGTKGMESFFPADKIMVTGNPVRKSIAQSQISKEEGLKFFCLPHGKETILGTGGSLGAQSINEAIAAQIDEFEKNDVQLIWQTGKLFTARAKTLTRDKANIWTNDFITQMEYAFAAADVVISRSGAMSVAELCVAKQAVIFVPYPFAAEDHQTVNAMQLVQQNAAILVKDSDANDQLVETAIRLAKDEQRQQILKTNIGRLAITNADEIVAEEILKKI